MRRFRTIQRSDAFGCAAMAAWPAYDLTTVRQPANRMVERTVSKLIAMIEDGDAEPQRIEIDGPLMVRGSARTPKG